MQTNFIISAYQKLWINGPKDLFIVEPYVYHVLEKNEELNKFINIKVAPFRRQSKLDMINDSDYVDKKYEKYIVILAKRLNQLHATTHSENFWRKVLSMAFIRYITLFHDLFQKCELYFNDTEYVCNILSQESYYIPLDFEDHRVFFQNKDYGQEQIFSIYIKLFYPDKFNEINQQPIQLYKEIEHDGLKIKTSDAEQSVYKFFIKKMIKRLQNVTLKKIIRKIYTITFGNIKEQIKQDNINKNMLIGIIGSYFSEKNLKELITKSNALIYPLDWNIDLNTENENIDWDKRTYLAEFENDFDRFDKFFFNSIKYCLPKAFVEHYNKIEGFYKKKFSKYIKLQYVISEGWISNTYMSIALALLQEMNIRHITNEHNCIFHIYAGSYIAHVILMSDIFVTLGWDDSKIPNLVKGASLFLFTIEGKYSKKYKILYISAPANVKMPHYSSSYGIDEENAPKSLKFVSAFLYNLKDETLKEITYRCYPKANWIQLLSYNKEYILRSCLKHIKNFSDTCESSKIQMLQAELVVIDYISTSYLESLSMNVPTVFFWDTDSYYLRDEYCDFFKPLVDVGICQTNPVNAANFVESIKDNPQKWWGQEDVQKAKNEFLNKNLGKPEVMIDYLLELLKK